MDSSFDLNDAYDGGNEFTNSIDNVLRQTVGSHYVVATCIIVVLVILVIYYAAKENFNPTRHLLFTDSDQYGLGRERFTKGKLLPGDPTLPAGQVGSAAYGVLNSNDFNCEKRKPSGDNAWDWMQGVAHESFTTLNHPPDDNTFSRKLSGY